MEHGLLKTCDLIGTHSTALHLWDSARLERENPMISSRSLWLDEEWYLDYDTPGAAPQAAKIHWPLSPPAQKKLREDEYVSLIDVMRRLAWSLLCDPRSGKAMKTTSMSYFGVGVRYLLEWMARRGYASVAELDSDACNQYLDDLVDFLAHTDHEDGAPEDEGISHGAAQIRTKIVWRLYKQSSALEEAGIAPMLEMPFGGESADKIAKELATRAEGEVPPLPDEVALPVLATAHRMLGVPAQDVLRLQSLYLKAYSAGGNGSHRGPGTSYHTRKHAADAAIDRFAFSTIPGEQAQWRPPLESETRNKIHKSRHINTSLTPLTVLRNLIQDVRDACTIVIQSEMGPRINEICSLTAGIDSASGLPTCIEVRRSKTGLNDLFYVKGLLSKTNDTPQPKEWLAGTCPVGSNYLPPPVVATQILNELYAPWRALAQNEELRTSLIVSFAPGCGGLPKSSDGISAIRTVVLAEGQRNFIMQYVDLSALPDRSARGEDLTYWRTTRGTCLKTHQWRKTFARYVRRTDPRMLPAVAQQFGHLSLAMTEESYPGNDSALLGDMESQRIIETAVVMRDLLRDDNARPAYGTMAKVIAEHREELKALVDGKDERDALQNIKCFVIEHDIRIWYANHGKCMIGANPLDARCHELAGTTHWLNRRSNYEQQAPTTCVGCSCFLVDHEHAWFWERRYVDNQSAWLDAVRNGCESEFYVARERANQAAQVLKVLKVNLPKVGDAT